MLTAILMATLATVPQFDLSASIERAVSTTASEWARVADVRVDLRARKASARLRVGHYVGILALDWISTEIVVSQGGTERNPLPLMGSSAGRVVTMGMLAAGWELLDKFLSRRAPHLAKMIRFLTSAYGACQINVNLGVTARLIPGSWEYSPAPMNLIPAQWQRGHVSYLSSHTHRCKDQRMVGSPEQCSPYDVGRY